MLEIRTLGGLTIRGADRGVINLGSHKAEALLVYLFVEGGVQNRSVLAALLWPESSQERASTSLRVALATIQKYLGGYLIIHREKVAINPDAETYFDLSDFEGKVADNQIDAALKIYQGDFLEGFYIRDSAEFEDWLRLEQDRIRDRFVSCLQISIINAIKSGNYSGGQAFARQLLKIEPLEESALRNYMLLLALDGQRNAALVEYENFTATLQSELGIEPSHETQALYDQLLKGEELIHLRPLAPAHNLPFSQTSFVNRKREIAQIRAIMQKPDCRLITLLGPGGWGKTRLAIQVAGGILEFFPDGIFFIPFEAGYSSNYMIPDIARKIGFNIDSFIDGQDPKIQIFDYLKNRSLLLIMDGFENVISAAGLVSELLAAAPLIKILTTSRQKLDIQGEWTFFLHGLPVQIQAGEDDRVENSGALELFIERAQQANTETRFSPDDLMHITHICQLVEGMPLAVELAAAWTSVLSLGEIVDELGDNPDFLSSSACDVPATHRSMRAIFNGSWRMLTEKHQETVSRLSVFRGGFDRAAAKYITGASISELSDLVNRSMLIRDNNGYFFMHELFKQFANEKLTQSPEIHQETLILFSQYYTDFLYKQKADLLGTKMLQARDEILRNIENVRAAVDWVCQNQEPQVVRRVLLALLAFYIIQGWHEGVDAFSVIARRRSENLVEKQNIEPARDPVFLCASIHQAFILSNLGQIEESETISRTCMDGLQELGLHGERSSCLHNLGVNASFRGDYKTAKVCLEEAILLGREHDFDFWPTYLLWLGHVNFLIGEYEQGLLSLKKCKDIFDQRGTIWGSAFALSKMGLAADGLGEHNQAMEYHREASLTFERIGSPAGEGYSLSRMSVSAYFLKDFAQALELGQSGSQILKEINHRWGICSSACWVGFAYIGLGSTIQAYSCLKNALLLAKQYQMVPLCLYALAGLSCVLVLQGQDRQAYKIYRFIKQHPQTPALCLKQADDWIEFVDCGEILDIDEPVLATIDDVIEILAG